VTFSIVAHDPQTNELGIAVASKFPAVGSLVPWIDLEAGAIATQAYANLEYGRTGLKLLKSGKSSPEVFKDLIDHDEGRETRQVGMIDKNGQKVTFTGKECYPWAGSIEGENFVAQGNILTGEEVVLAMKNTFIETKGDLAEKLMCALEAGNKAGGDSRGEQSAHLLVYKKNSGYGGGSDVYIDVRVDDHPQAVSELRRVFELYSLTLLEREELENIQELTPEVYNRICKKLLEIGFIDKLPEDNVHKQTVFIQWLHTYNFENKERSDGYVWNSILEYLFSL
jgi:uncharacterized Ntn-hydrolase superfamily protein